jgi:dihydroorotase
VLELVRGGGLSELDAVSRMSTQPARLMGLRGGTLEVGAAADLALIDPDRAWKAGPGELSSRSKNSAFLGREMLGRAVRTWVAGKLVHDLIDEPGS